MPAGLCGELLRSLKEHGLHTALDTTGFAPWATVERVLPFTDLFLYDLKTRYLRVHEAAVGVPNEQILENARRIAAAGGTLQVRVPVIPLFNDSEENLRSTARFCCELGKAVEVVQLLPYHNLGVMKYQRISDQKAVEATPPSDEKNAEDQGALPGVLPAGDHPLKTLPLNNRERARSLCGNGPVLLFLKAAGTDTHDCAGHCRPVWSMVYSPVRMSWEMGTML